MWCAAGGWLDTERGQDPGHLGAAASLSKSGTQRAHRGMHKDAGSPLPPNMVPDGLLDSVPWKLTHPSWNDESRTIQGLSLVSWGAPGKMGDHSAALVLRVQSSPVSNMRADYFPS